MRDFINATFLVTAIGTVNGGAVIGELKKYLRGIKVLGANSTPKEYVPTAKFVDEYFEFPTAVDDKEAYLKYVLGFCREKAVDFIISFIDEEVENFTKNWQLFEEAGVTLCLPDYKTVRTCHFKNIFVQWIRDCCPDLAIRTYENVDAVEKPDLPVFVKPYEGRAGIGCRSIDTLEQLLSVKKEVEKGEKLIVQQKISGQIYGVDIIRNRKYNQVRVIQKKELARNANGCGTVVEITNDRLLTGFCIDLAEKLDLNGVVNAEFFMTNRGPKIIEVNPRLPAGTSFSCMAGCNTVLNSVYIACGVPCVFGDVKVGKIYARRYETYEM